MIGAIHQLVHSLHSCIKHDTSVTISSIWLAETWCYFSLCPIHWHSVGVRVILSTAKYYVSQTSVFSIDFEQAQISTTKVRVELHTVNLRIRQPKCYCIKFILKIIIQAMLILRCRIQPCRYEFIKMFQDAHSEVLRFEQNKLLKNVHALDHSWLEMHL